jgi:hypothetical protein
MAANEQPIREFTVPQDEVAVMRPDRPRLIYFSILAPAR